MNSIMLPFRHQRAVLRSFWMCISFAFGVGLTLACWLLGVPFPIGIGLAGVAAFGMILVFHEELVRRLYRALEPPPRSSHRPFCRPLYPGHLLFHHFCRHGTGGFRAPMQDARR